MDLNKDRVKNYKTERFGLLLALLDSKDLDIEANVEKKILSEYKKGEPVYKEGTLPYGVFYLKSGKVKVVTVGNDGKEQIVRLVRPGDILGYRSIFSGGRYYTSAIALEDSDLYFIPKEIFVHLVENNKELAREVFKLLSENLKEAQVKLTAVAQKTVRERVAEAILFIKDTYGVEADGRTVAATFSREDLANMVGTATETAIRLLSELRKEEVIHLRGKKITILDEKRLTTIANINS